MAKFKVGDRVRRVKGSHRGMLKGEEDIVIAGNDYDGDGDQITLSRYGSGHWDIKFELVTESKQGEKVMGRRTFKLLRDTPTMAKGAIYQEACDDGTQEYVLLTKEQHYKDERSGTPSVHKRSLVEENPKWFVEVFQVTPQYMTRDELDSWEAFKRAPGSTKRVIKVLNQKPQKRKYVKSGKYAKKTS